MSRPLPIVALLVLTACSVTVDGEQRERDLAAAAGARYGKPFEDRGIPAAEAELADWIAAAESRNGDLEAAFHRWCAAIEDVPQAATQDTNLMLGAQHRFDGGAALDRSALAAMTDPMANWLWPERLRARGDAALQRARVAGAEFWRARLALQRDTAARYHALAELDGSIRLQEQLCSALALAEPSLQARLATGNGSQRELLGARAARLDGEARLARMRGERTAAQQALRAIAGLSPRDTIDPRPRALPFAALTDGEEDFVARALAHAPDLEVRRREHDAALAAITVQEWRRVPEFSLQAMLGGDGMLQLLGGVTLPFLRAPALDAAVRQAEAEARAADAMRRQLDSSTTADVLTELAAQRALQTEYGLVQQQCALATQVATNARASWSAGKASIAEWIGAEAMRLDKEQRLLQLAAEAAIGRARLLAAIGESLVPDT